MAFSNDTKSRKWLVTINNPLEKGYTHDRIKEELSKFTSMAFWCMSDEIGENGTFHTHIYIALNNATRFSTLKTRFEGAHFDLANGTSQQNKDYVFKEGKWEKDKKKDTNLKETHEEYGECPVERQGHRTDLEDLYDMIKQGMSNFEIIESSPQYMLNVDKIERTRQIIKEEMYKNTFRNLEVTYIYGGTGTGKTRSVMETFGYENVYRITDEKNPFDNYKCEDVIIFEEFRSTFRIQDMLNYLDGYPLQLPCRYANKIACYTKVFLITNLPIREQYENVQKISPETWKAFLRRIHIIEKFEKEKKSVKTDLKKINLLENQLYMCI